ncbi:hypothetical protein H0A71_18825 [Alcaligenaceae bacterium]|nr:hypothetical protein [Alcaligenaceae bacterium]
MNTNNASQALNQAHIDFVITQSSIDNGRIYFSSNDIDFFPADSLGGRGKDEHASATVSIQAGNITQETDIRHSSSVRISPRKSFKAWLKEIGATDGDKARLYRISERQYRIEYPG